MATFISCFIFKAFRFQKSNRISFSLISLPLYPPPSNWRFSLGFLYDSLVTANIEVLTGMGGILELMDFFLFLNKFRFIFVSNNNNVKYALLSSLTCFVKANTELLLFIYLEVFNRCLLICSDVWLRVFFFSNSQHLSQYSRRPLATTASAECKIVPESQYAMSVFLSGFQVFIL